MECRTDQVFTPGGGTDGGGTDSCRARHDRAKLETIVASSSVIRNAMALVGIPRSVGQAKQHLIMAVARAQRNG
jgi:hypothetical protein